MALATDSQWHDGPGTTDGQVVGRNATSKIGFFGATPVVKNATPWDISSGTVAELAAILAAYGLINTTP